MGLAMTALEDWATIWARFVVFFRPIQKPDAKKRRRMGHNNIIPMPRWSNEPFYKKNTIIRLYESYYAGPMCAVQQLGPGRWRYRSIFLSRLPG